MIYEIEIGKRKDFKESGLGDCELDERIAVAVAVLFILSFFVLFCLGDDDDFGLSLNVCCFCWFGSSATYQ